MYYCIVGILYSITTLKPDDEATNDADLRSNSLKKFQPGPIDASVCRTKAFDFIACYPKNIDRYKINIIIFMILAAATVLTHTMVDRYEKSGPDLLTGQWLGGPSENSRSRRADIQENEIALFSYNPKAGVNVYQEISGLDPGTSLGFIYRKYLFIY